MAIRVTQHTMYNNMVSNMQNTLGNYMESVQQGSTQKKINRPSDDPAGTYRVMTTRVDMTNTAQYQENVDTAKGWLKLADNVLSSQVTNVIIGLTELASQASSGEYTQEQREIMADQARQYFGQLLNLANTEFEGKSIFGGHKYDQNAFEQGLAVTTWDEDWQKLANGGGIQITGNDPDHPLEHTVMVQFIADQDGMTLGTDTKFRWTSDGGKSWHDVEGGVTEIKDAQGTTTGYSLDANGIILNVSKPVKEDGTLGDIPLKKMDDPDEKGGANNGTMLYIRPAAIYMGDDKDPPANITKMGAGVQNATVTTQGDFGKNVLVRVDSDPDATTGEFFWAYSTDGGSTWVKPLKATVAVDANTNIDSTRLPIPGGYMDIEGAAGLKAGDQIMVHPSRADLDYEIMKDTYLEVNSVGKDVFGGRYENKAVFDNGTEAVPSENLFEVVGAFIGYLEGNVQQGCQQTLAALKKAEKQILAEATRVGGMETRIDMAADVLSFQKLDQQERLSYTEDIDLTELLTKLTRQQITYQTVLQSSSMIMQLSLANYV